MKLSAVLIVVFSALIASSIASQIVINEASRIIDLGGGFARHGLTLTLENHGSAAKRFQVALMTHDVSAVVVTHKDKFLDVTGPHLKTQDGHKFSVYDVTFPAPLETGKTITVKVEGLITRNFEPFQQITQKQDNHLLYRDNIYILSPYTVRTQKTRIEGSRQILKHTDSPAVTVDGTVLNYGPFADVSPLTIEPSATYFVSSAPLIRVTSLVKEVEVSHWGNVAVEENYVLKNAGNELDKGFSRVDYMFGQTGNSFNLFSQYIPADADEPYYRDVIGNVSTSHIHVHKEEKMAKFDIRPRFIMFGGWKTEFTLGYNLPLSHYLSVLPSGKFALDINFSTEFVQEVYIDDFELRFVLPEGVTDIEVTFPFEVKENERSIRPTYLDTVGRTVISFSKNNIVNVHNQKVQIRYNYSSSNVIQDPLLLISAFFALFVTLIIYFRLDFSISK